MSLSHFSLVSRLVQVDGSEDITQYIPGIDVHRRENALDTAQIKVNDDANYIWDDLADTGTQLQIYMNYREVEDPPTNYVFNGYIDDVIPSVGPSGAITVYKARSIGRSLVNMVCGQEYGVESKNPTLDTLQEILDDASNGIIPLWVNKILGSGTDSGYSLGYSTYIADIKDAANPLQYLYFPFKSVLHCLNDLMDLATAQMRNAGAPTAGPHWIVTPGDELCVATVAAHETAITPVWPTYWNTLAADSTFVITQDMQVTSFTKQAQEANYILYDGELVKPGGRDVWSENNSGDWSVTGVDAGTAATISDEGPGGANVFRNSYSIKVTTGDGVAGSAIAKYPDAGGMNWTIDLWGGEYNVPYFNLYVKVSANVGITAGAGPLIYFHTTDNNNYYLYTVGSFLENQNVNNWSRISIPVGPYATTYWASSDFAAVETGAPDWNDIDYIRFEAGNDDNNVATFYLDGMHFTGHILRGAKQTGADFYKIKVITDDVGKDDSGVAATDTFPMARYAYAELSRASTTPITGKIKIPAQPTIMGGQLCHIHAHPYSTTAYRIDSDFRITEHHLHLGADGFFSYLTVTNDVTNGRPMSGYSAYNTLMKATTPEFQNRQISSIKTRLIDVTQTILEKSYAI
jgi:hypothetical protein